MINKDGNTDSFLVECKTDKEKAVWLQSRGWRSKNGNVSGFVWVSVYGAYGRYLIDDAVRLEEQNIRQQATPSFKEIPNSW